MHICAGITRCRSLLIIPFILLFLFALSACGTNTTTGATPGNTVTAPVATATASQSKTTTEGCPSSTVVTTPPAAANVVLTTANSGTTITVKKGDVVEVDLAFGHTWQGPTNMEPGLLTVQGPAGYVFTSAKACVWRFLATGTGTAHLSFAGRPICKQGQVCPMYIMAVPFTVNIQ